MNDLEKKLSSLSPEQRSMLEARLKQRSAAPDTAGAAGAAGEKGISISDSLRQKGMGFSLIFFSGDGSTDGPDKYRLVLESAKFADQNGFQAIWTPERHFQAVGGLYPNPSVLSAALATITDNIQLRAGSVVLPLHHPLRVAEEWSLVDNLSRGRAAISVATGWHPADFILKPEYYENRKEVMYEHLELIRRLWRGESVECKDISGQQVEVAVLPKPVQPELPVFLTASGNPATWSKAGEQGFHVLCSMATHTLDALKERIQLYREQRAKHGHDPEAGIVSVMVHTCVGEKDQEVKEQVRGPLRDYLDTFLDQYETLNPLKDEQSEVGSMLSSSRDALITFAFEKYFQISSLMGSKEKCAAMIEKLHRIGVDEVACLLDFGLEFQQVMEGLEHLNELRSWFTPAKLQVPV
ncbi:amino acid adenylation domain-containing protein [Paenibacillus algicola]|uniref:Amino acid adenylation domain-containing protein n=1 Tax=Paenibacillus algicola TaxID=2565926 RepID=A0A4P8XNA9_9BACL|nr:LLM class flavin-dependent oxidoreductase [Paenibacillus algicola]QCT04332.1 amino acid adenylation domain-containing protein [Paenibacillus algicola]